MIDDFITFKLFDKYNYRRMGLVGDWSLGDAVLVLASFDMQTNGLCELKDAAEHQSRLYNDYVAYVMSLIDSGKLKHDEDNNLINKDELLELMEANNVLKLDVAKLKRFLSCEEEPNTSIPVEEITHVAAVTTLDVESMTCIEKDAICAEELPRVESCHVSDAIHRDDHTVEIVGDGANRCTDESSDSQYRFIKHGLGWNILFGSTKLDGVKHSVGMDYIKLLLQCPYTDIGVLELQSMMNPATIRGSRERMLEEFNSDDGEEGTDKPEFADSDIKVLVSLSDEKRKELIIYTTQVKELKAKHEEARLNNETSEVTRLNGLICMLKDQAETILKSRTDDPVLNANRKNVWKNIRDAKVNIQTFELEHGYSETPTFNYLDKYIETGYTCKYNPLVEDPISWIF